MANSFTRILRPAQQDAIMRTLSYWRGLAEDSPADSRRFLWNAKPRFGKTIAAYALSEEMSARRILIITNRPAISDSWLSDYQNYLAENTDYIFAAKRKIAEGTFSRAELIHSPELLNRPLIYFVSLQDLKGDSGNKPENKWIFDIETPWDLVILDESHEGVRTAKTSRILKRLKSNFVLHLSGTPFRALAGGDFSDAQIFNYTYLDEQKSQLAMPRLTFCTFSRPDNDDALLNYFAELFQAPGLNLLHTFWLLSGVSECRALAAKLSRHPFFSSYKIITAVGRHENYSTDQKILSKLRSTIGTHPEQTRTITLSCGQLASGVTVPEWSAVFMLYNSTDLSRTSSTFYLQAAFRAQNPCAYLAKTNGYVFDFMPERIITIVQDYAANLCSEPASLALNHFLEYTDVKSYNHETHSLDAVSADGLASLPKKIIAREIVDQKFVFSDYLFRLDPMPELSPRAQKVLARISPQRKSPTSSLAKDLETSRVDSTLEPPAPDSRSHKSVKPYRDKIRALSYNFPLLIFLYASSRTTLQTFPDRIPVGILESLAGITNDDFRELINAGCFNEDNFNLAIREFKQREQNFSEYYQDLASGSIFDFIGSRVFGEIATPRAVVEQMLLTLENLDPEIFKNPNKTFLDPAAKSGIFLQAVAKRLFVSERQLFASDHECLEHIFTKQIFAFCPDRNFSKIVTKHLLSAPELKHFSLNLKIARPAKGGKDFMKFDIILGNPPYQQGRRQIYADFYKLAVDLDPEYLCMVFPQGWQKMTNHNGLGLLNNSTYKRDPHIVSIDNYDRAASEQLFPGLGTGAVNIIVRSRHHDNHGEIKQLVNGSPVAAPLVLPLTFDEIAKPLPLKSLAEKFVDAPKVSSLASARSPYRISADALRHPEKYHLALSAKPRSKSDLRILGLLADETRGVKYCARDALSHLSPLVDSFKLFVPKAWGNMSARVGLGGSYANIIVAAPGDVCTETFIEFGAFRDRNEAIRMAKYFSTQFFRALLFLAKSTQNTTRDKYRFIPLLDLSDPMFGLSVAELDLALIKKFKIDQIAAKLLREQIQPRDETNIEIL